jgi:lipoprotein-anchoring transpeptidase ErfK/SrfK
MSVTILSNRVPTTRKVLVPLLAVLVLAGCTVGSAGLDVTPTPTPPMATAVPSFTPVASPTLAPTMSPTASPTPTVTPTPSPVPTRGPEMYYGRFILINQDTQTMFVYENGVRIRTIPISSGKPDQEETMTPVWEGEVGKYVGTFFSYGTWADNAWYLFEHYGSMLIHSAPYLKADGEKVYQDLDALGVRPLSHGCIRLPPEEAQWFTDWGPQGAHVIIQPLTRKF